MVDQIYQRIPSPVGGGEGRDISRSPSLSPTPAVSSCPSPDRTFSTVSSLSNFSGDRSSVSISSKRRGYIRPQGSTFAESAKHRESVMSLGSIAHLQYYFARTGLLDGKGGQMAREFKKKKKKEDGSSSSSEQGGGGAEQDIPKLMLTQQPQFGGDFVVESPIDDDQVHGDPMEEWDENEPIMLPPTVSTYSIRNPYIPPPPDLETLRHDLESALSRAHHVLTATRDQLSPQLLSPSAHRREERDRSPDGLPDSEEESSDTSTATKVPMSYNEMEGMHIIDVVTFALRATRIYYTSHEDPERLSTIKSERVIRDELLAVMDVLKKWASRNFTDGLRDEERTAIKFWITQVRAMLAEERKLEESEFQKKVNWRWVKGDWTAREREREELFIRSLETGDRPLPAWISAETNPLPTDFLDRLRDGRDLIRYHNEAVRLSHRHFGKIKTYHEDVGKPYRMADNLRFWMKAAEIRWEIKLDVDVMGVVNGDSDEAWKKFDVALMLWCKKVREELIQDWKDKVPKMELKTISPEGDVHIHGVDAIS